MQKIDFDSMSGVWKSKNITVKTIKKKAWGYFQNRDKHLFGNGGFSPAIQNLLNQNQSALSGLKPPLPENLLQTDKEE